MIESGYNLDELSRKDIVSFDEFHIGGMAQTLEMGKLAGIRIHDRVLDIGCGVGGPARTLSSEFGCRVDGLDFSFEFCRAAALLNELIGESSKIDLVCAEATELPFTSGAYDLVLLQHITMNVADKKKLFSEVKRVLKPGGRLVLFEVMAADGPGLQYPVFWAQGADSSFLEKPEMIRSLLVQLGFIINDWSDHTQTAIAWYHSIRDKKKNERENHLKINLITGPDSSIKARNVYQGLKSGSICLIQALLTNSL